MRKVVERRNVWVDELEQEFPRDTYHILIRRGYSRGRRQFAELAEVYKRPEADLKEAMPEIVEILSKRSFQEKAYLIEALVPGAEPNTLVKKTYYVKETDEGVKVYEVVMQGGR